MDKKESIEKEKKIYVVREKFVAKNNKEYYAYVVNCNIKGRETKIDFVPKDKGGYEVLDFLYMFSDKAELNIGTQKVDGVDYPIYTLSTTDENGEIMECGVRPAKDSDKWLLRMVLGGKK